MVAQQPDLAARRDAQLEQLDSASLVRIFICVGRTLIRFLQFQHLSYLRLLTVDRRKERSRQHDSVDANQQDIVRGGCHQLSGSAAA